jgi:hypothetical protein
MTGWTPEGADALVNEAKRTFPGSHEVPIGRCRICGADVRVEVAGEFYYAVFCSDACRDEARSTGVTPPYYALPANDELEAMEGHLDSIEREIRDASEQLPLDKAA